MIFNIFVSALFIEMSYTDIILATIISTVSVILIDLVLCFIARRLTPAKWCNWNTSCFDAKKKTRRIYEKLGIKKWKDKVIELGALTSFRKNKIKDPQNNEYIERYMAESNYGVLCHIYCMFFGFLVIFVLPLKVWWCFGLPVGIVNFMLNLLPYMILKYNLPKLRVVHKLNEKRKLKDNC